MKTQLSSRTFLHGFSLYASIILAITVSSAAYAQAQGDCFSSSSDDSFDDCRFRGDRFTSTGYSGTQRLIGVPGGYPYSAPRYVTYFTKDLPDQNSAFEENEQIDPDLFTWSDDPRDAFAASPTDSLQKFPLYKGTMRSLSFVKISDGQETQSSYKKNFAPPKAEKFPKWNFAYWGTGGGGPVSGDSFKDSFGVWTQVYGWPYSRQPIRVYFAGDVGDARDGLVKRVFIECMRQWCSATKGLLKFTVSEDSRSADIILCRDLTTNHELAENNPTFHNAWLDRVKIKLLDSTLDSLGEAQLRAVLLHSAGHAIGYFQHTPDTNSAMNEECSHVWHPTQKLCPCDAAYIKKMYLSYKKDHDGTLVTSEIHMVRVPFGKPMPLMAGFGPIPGSVPQYCGRRVTRPTTAMPRLSLTPIATKLPTARKTTLRAMPTLPNNHAGPTSQRLSFKP